MKSQVSAILRVLQGVLTDARAAYPSAIGFDRDYSRLSQLCQTRGLGTLALDLPVLSDFLREGLEAGRLPDRPNPFGWKSKRTRVPRLFAGLWMRVFDSHGVLRPDADIDAVAFLDQLSTIAKKVRVPCSQRRNYVAMKGYVDVESQARSPSLNWQGDHLGLEEEISAVHLVDFVEKSLPLLESSRSHRIVHLLAKCQHVADTIVGSMLKFDPIIWSDILMEYEGVTGLRHGTGAVARKETRQDKSDFQTWPRKLEGVFPFELFGKCPNDTRQITRMEYPSKLHLVPKTLKGPRIIAAEPVEHQWCQQLILNFLVFEFDRLFNGRFIDLFDQGKSGAMALRASRDKSLATVDLSDASDRLTCAVVERMLRKNIPLLRALHAVRTRFVCLDEKQRHFLAFKKYASQGTGTTFPVQSLVFLIIAIAASIRGPINMASILRLRGTVRVYGDDIIIPTHGYEDLNMLMATLGLKVNEKKSFTNGFYRESCGTNAFRGYDVTPVKPQVFSPDNPSDVVALVDESNNLFKKGYWHAANALLSNVPNYAMRRLRIVGPGSPGTPGLYSFIGCAESHLRRRWNDALQRREVLTFAYNTKARRAQRDGYARLVDFSTMAYNPWNPRVVSEFEHSRYAKGGVRWEPSVEVM